MESLFVVVSASPHAEIPRPMYSGSRVRTDLSKSSPIQAPSLPTTTCSLPSGPCRTFNRFFLFLAQISPAFHPTMTMSLSASQYAVPQGSTVLITGVNGFIASHIADQFLTFGFKVRGTTRNLEKHIWIKTLFDKKHGPGNFEMVAVPDMAVQGAFLQVVKGVSAVVHTATVFSLDSSPYNVIPGTVAGTLNALKAAAQEPGVRRFVLTSSSSACLIPKPGTSIQVTSATWNDEAVELAYRDPPYTPERALPVYAASKTLAEKEAWKFVREEKPGFVFNAVLPNMNFGPSLDFPHQGHPSTSALVAELFRGNANFLGGITPRRSHGCITSFIGGGIAI